NVGSIQSGASWVGALDMSGNVWEWVSSAYMPYPYAADDGRNDTNTPAQYRVLRGGGWLEPTGDNLRAAARNASDPTISDQGIGFRCARSPDTSTATTPTGSRTVTRNEDWTPQFQDFGGVTMALVPAGCFEMGNDPNAYDY